MEYHLLSLFLLVHFDAVLVLLARLVDNCFCLVVQRENPFELPPISLKMSPFSRYMNRIWF